LVRSNSQETGWSVFSYVPYKNVTERLLSLRLIFLVLCFFTVLFIVIASLFVSNSFTKPIKQMQNAMKAVKNGILSTKIEHDRNDEFGDLYNGFNKLTGQLNTMIDNVADARRSEETAKYHMLMSQINPHFLYNTLDSIRMMSVFRNQPEIAKALLHLSNLFRYSIKQRDEPLTVREELSQAENYLSLQKLRFQDDIEISYEIDDNVLEQKMPKILL